MRLVAYIILQAGEELTETDLREYLGNSLPKYMIPQHVVKLDALPLTPNGKIDRKALLGSSLELSESISNNYSEFETDMQKQIASIWQDALEIDQIDPYDNFFEVGGYSLLSMQVLEKIRLETGVHVPARAILTDSLAQIASYCEKGGDGEEQQSTTKKLFSGLRKSFGFKK
jgi:hypothetical protein